MATFEKLDNSEVKFDITIPEGVFDEGLKKAYSKHAKRYNIPGFRKGKAPRRMIEKYYGDGVFFQAAFEEVYWEPYIEAVEKADVTPVGPPDIVIEEIGEGLPLHFVATVPVKPEFKVYKKDYKGVKIPKIHYDVTDEMVDNQLNAQRDHLARYVEVDRPVEDGDQVNIDYSGSVDGVKFDGGTAAHQFLQIGAGQFIPGFEEQIIGKNVGDEFDITVTFPEEYHAEELAGKEAVFAITLNESKRKELPELDDELAKDISEFETLDALRADIREKLEAEAKEREVREMRSTVMEAVVDRIDFIVPEAMIERQIDRVLNDMSQRMSAQGMSLEDYLGYTNVEMDDFRRQLHPDAERRVRADLILEKVVDNEKIEVSDERFEQEMETLARSIQRTVEETKAMISDADMEAIKRDIAIGECVQFLLDNAKLVDPEKLEKELAEEKAKAQAEKEEKEQEDKES